MLCLSSAHVRRVRDAAHALSAPHAFPDERAWAAAALEAARAAFGSDAAVAQFPAFGAPDAAGDYAGQGIDAALVARCERLFRLGPAASDDPAAGDAERILAACLVTGQRAWTGPAFLARARDVVGDGRLVRGSAFVHEIIAPAGLWRGPHLHARLAGRDAVLGFSPPRPAARLRGDDALLLAELLQPAFAAGVRAAHARWAPAIPPAAASRPARQTPGPTALTLREREVAALLAARRTNAEVAAALGVSAHTARHHVERVMRKLGARSRRDVR